MMRVRKWVRRDDPQLDPHGEMRGKVQRAPDRKFGLLLLILPCILSANEMLKEAVSI